MSAANKHINLLDYEPIIYSTEHPDKARGWREGYMVRARSIDTAKLPPMWKVK